MRIILVILFLTSCKSQTVIEDKGRQRDKSGSTEADDAEQIAKDAAQVAIPENITGGYLTCSLESTANDSKNEAEVLCAVKSKATNNIYNLDEDSNWQGWSYQLPDDSDARVVQTLLNDSLDWHVRYTISSTNDQATNQLISKITFSIKYTLTENTATQMSGKIEPQVATWLALDSAIIPENAVAGGSEAQNSFTLYLCRIYVNDAILPGKLLPHYADPSKSICYVSYETTTYESQSGDGLSVTYNSDVLILDSGSFDDFFTWVDAKDGNIPEEAFISGRTDQGDPLYTCRGLENGLSNNPNTLDNSPDGEYTPGLIGDATNGCQHEFYGLKTTSSYQVLTWTGQVTTKSSFGLSLPSGK